MQVRKPSEQDVDGLLEFFARVPESERTFFKEQLLDRAAVEGWVTSDRGRRALAQDDDGTVIGYAAVIPLTGWSDHVGDVRLVVDPARRGQGVGRGLARWALLQAVDCGLSKLTVEVVAEQDGAVAMFTGLGFQAEGLFRDHVRDRGGELRDLIVLSHSVNDAWAAMETAGIDDALA